MIELFDTDKKDIGRKSSKGNQLKWEKNGIWYKADFTGYEGLAEYVISSLLSKTTLEPQEFVVYKQEEMSYKSQSYMGASCKDFLEEGEQLITLERLFQSTYGIGLNKIVYSTEDHEERLKLIVNKTTEITGLSGFGVYMAKMLTVDSFFLNEDRHSHNIAVILETAGTYRLCPIFDQGASLLSDTTMDYPLTEDTYALMDAVTPKTFCQDFREQVEIAEKMFGDQVRFNFSKKDVDEVLGQVIGYTEPIIQRVRAIIYEQMRRYGYLF